VFRFDKRAALLATVSMLTVACGGPSDERPLTAIESAAPTTQQIDSLTAASDSADALDLRRRQSAMATREQCLAQAAGLPQPTRAKIEASCRNRLAAPQ
jgi:hypothetical protein